MKEPSPLRKALLKVQDYAWRLDAPFAAKRRMARYRKGEITFDEALLPDSFLMPSAKYRADNSLLMNEIQKDEMLRSEFERLSDKERDQVRYLVLLLGARLVKVIRNESIDVNPGDAFDLGPRYEGYPPNVVVLCSSVYERCIELHRQGKIFVAEPTGNKSRGKD